jgi:hypothetical protein
VPSFGFRVRIILKSKLSVKREQWDEFTRKNAPHARFLTKYEVRLMCREDGIEINASVGALHFFRSPFSPTLHILRGGSLL